MECCCPGEKIFGELSIGRDRGFSYAVRAAILGSGYCLLGLTGRSAGERKGFRRYSKFVRALEYFHVLMVRQDKTWCF
jgi:hypothetical protein